MPRPRILLLSVSGALAALTALASCAGKTADPASARQAGAATKDAPDAAGAAAGDAGPPSRPFAGSAFEATELIGLAVEKKATEVLKCIGEYRARKKLPHERVSIQLGIDQEGHLLGAALPKGNHDRVLSECLQTALASAPFPRSHSGVISVTKSYEEIVQ